MIKEKKCRSCGKWRNESGFQLLPGRRYECCKICVEGIRQNEAKRLIAHNQAMDHANRSTTQG